MTKRLNTAMMLRYETFESDMGALVDSIKRAHNPPGLLATKIKEMQWGTFEGKARPDEETDALCKKFKLDEQSANKLTHWLNSRGMSTRSEDLKMVLKHLEFANKPSAKVMQLVGRLWSGQTNAEMPPASRTVPGSFDLRSSLTLAQAAQRQAFSPDAKPWWEAGGRARSRSRGR